MITLKQVEAFYWVATLGSFAAASARIHVAQSTVSKRILELETSLNLQLFDRDQRSGRLTPKGAELLVMAEKLLRMRDKFIQAVGNKEVVTGTLKIGVTELVAMTWLSRFVAAIRESYPLLVIEPVVDLVVNLYTRLEERSVDLVIGPRVYKDDRFTSTLLTKVEQAWMCSPEMHPGGGPIPLRDLKKMTVLLQSSGSGLQFMLNRLLEENEIRLKSVIYCNGMMALAQMASAGLGVTCLPKSFFQPEIKAKRLKILETTPAVPPLLYAVASRRDAVGNLGGVVSAMAVQLCDFESPAAAQRPKPRST